ncbi:YolD-like family protein [Paenibacillus sp. FSL K6-2524]|uniref:YolD-like family protein n=1 Tax=Paenibacillus sp. FSL K6-2524 TaxID=2954516 RepID=UPI0030F5BE19
MYSVPKPSKKYKESRPKRDYLELEELAERLTEAKESNTVLTFSIWRWEDDLKGTITNMDSLTQSVHIADVIGEIHKVPFIDIMAVVNAE